MRQEMVLLYEINGKERENKLKSILIRLGIRIKTVKREEYLEKLGYLAKIKGIEATRERYEGEPLGDEMMVLVGFTYSRLNLLLFEIKKARLEKVNLKAVVTDSNKEWNSLQLFKEIKEEHEAMAEMGEQKNTGKEGK